MIRSKPQAWVVAAMVQGLYCLFAMAVDATESTELSRQQRAGAIATPLATSPPAEPQTPLAWTRGPSIFAPGRFTNDPATGRPVEQFEVPKAEQSVAAQHHVQAIYGTAGELLPMDPNVGPWWGWGNVWSAPPPLLHMPHHVAPPLLHMPALR